METQSVRSFAVMILLTLGLALALPGQAAAQGPKMAVINTQEIVFESTTGKKALEDIQTLQQQRQQEVEAKQAEITELRNRLNEGRLSLSEDKLAELQSELETKLRDLRRFQEDAAAELEKKRSEVLAGIEEQVMPVINQIGEEGGYTMIFRKFESGLLYVDEAVDITAQVIERLDAGASAGGQGQ